MRIAHCTTVHVRTDTRIFRKECASIANKYGNTYFIVADGKGDHSQQGGKLKVVDIGVTHFAGRLLRILLQPFRMMAKLFRLRPTIIHIHDPELLPLALVFRCFRVKVIYDIHEDLPKQILTKHWISPGLRSLVAKFAQLFEDFSAARMSALIVATPAIGKRFRGKNRLMEVINNYPISDELISPAESNVERRHICYVGALTRVRGISQILDALQMIPDLRLQLCGPFESTAYERELRAHPAWSRVDYHGVVDRDQMRDILNGSFAGLVTFLAAPNHSEAQPQKIYEYMSAGVPVIASDFPLWRRLIVSKGVGLCVDPDNPIAIAEACKVLMFDPGRVCEMGERGKEVIARELSWDKEVRKLFDLYDQLLFER